MNDDHDHITDIVLHGEVVDEDDDLHSSDREAYTDRFVSAALVLLEANDGNVKKTARDLKIPYSTLRAWASGERRRKHGALSRDMIKSELVPLFFAGVHDFFDSAHENIDDMSPYQRAIVGGIYTDKLIALSGIPTQVSEVRVLGAINHRITAWGTNKPVQDDED